LFLTIIIIFWGCDPPAYYNYFIINECDEKINVYFEPRHTLGKYNGDTNILIPPNEMVLIYPGRWINRVEDWRIEWFFEKITIHKGNKISKVNYIDRNLWKFESTSKSHANSYLTVYPKDFEDE